MATPLHVRKFGFLVKPITGDFAGGRIECVEEHEELAEMFVERSNKDGFLYPPEIATWTCDPLTGKAVEKVQRSARPAAVYSLPSSHTFMLTAPLDASTSTSSDDVLIIYPLSYLYGTRLQPSSWRVEGRIPVKSLHNIFIRQDVALHFISHVYSWWRSTPPVVRTRFINAIFVLARAWSLEWEWDKFSNQYMVFDALYKLYAVLEPGKKANNHRDRFDLLIGDFGIKCNTLLVNKLYKTRNELFHEAMWTGSTFGFKSSDDGSHQLPTHLGRLNSRLVCCLVGYRNEYSRSAWWSMGTFAFDRPN